MPKETHKITVKTREGLNERDEQIVAQLAERFKVEVKPPVDDGPPNPLVDALYGDDPFSEAPPPPEPPFTEAIGLALSGNTSGEIMNGVYDLSGRDLVQLYAATEEIVGKEIDDGSLEQSFTTGLVKVLRQRRQSFPEEIDPRTGMNIYDAIAIDELRKWMNIRLDKNQADIIEHGPDDQLPVIAERREAFMDVLGTPTRDGIMKKIDGLEETSFQVWRDMLYKSIYLDGVGEVWQADIGFNRTVLNDMYDLTEKMYGREQSI